MTRVTEENSANKPRVTAILQEAGLLDFSMVRPDIMGRAQVFGTAAHRAAQLDDLHTLDMNSVDRSIMGYLESWRKFCKDYGLTFTPEEIEYSLVSKKYGFRGTPDRWHTEKGLLVDIKTSTVMSAATKLQTAAYQILIEENIGIKIKKRMGVQLTENGYKIAPPYNDKSDKPAFLSFLYGYNWKKREGYIK